MPIKNSTVSAFTSMHVIGGFKILSASPGYMVYIL